ncbi:MAG: holo-ACP synthase [Acidobacteria bacterium]|nr:holo-ACP synthase [Acidobacteriota bacterium]
MIISIGTDVVQIQRIERIWDNSRGPFQRRIFHPDERADHPEHITPSFVAGRFAAKEALAKALGTGIAEGVSWRHLQIFRQPKGAPRVVLIDKAQDRARAMGCERVHLSISHEKDYAIAFVVLEGD